MCVCVGSDMQCLYIKLRQARHLVVFMYLEKQKKRQNNKVELKNMESSQMHLNRMIKTFCFLQMYLSDF